MTVHFLIPGDIYSLTGGYLYNMHMMEGLRQKGHSVNILGTDWPWNNIPELEKTSRIHFENLAPDTCIVADSLAFVPLHRMIRKFADRLAFTGLVHLPASFDIHSGIKGNLSYEDLQALHAMRKLIVTGEFTFELLCNAGMNPVKIYRVEPGTEPFPRKKQYKTVPSVFLCIANYSALKAQDVLVRALHRLPAWEWTMHFYGNRDRDYTYYMEVGSLVKQFKLENRIFLHGAVERKEISAVFLDADLFVMPSLFESFGMALTESLAHGIPVVTTSAGNIPNSIPARAGIFTKPGDPEHLADEIRSLLTDKAKYAALCNAASLYYKQARSWEQAVEEFIDLMIQ